MLTDKAFQAVTDFFHEASGIRLTPAKRTLVVGRLQKLAQDKGFQQLDGYVRHALSGEDADETRRLIDRLTTNETYFFREPEHFALLGELAERAPRDRPFRVWSAASSSGEEAYSIAMVLAERIGPGGWEVVGTDLSGAMVKAAQTALYPMERARDIPLPLLRRHCLKGGGPYEGQLLVGRALRAHVRFQAANLTQPLPDLGRFDVIFLRNVLIYFDLPGKADIVQRVMTLLRPGGRLFTGHAESINNIGVKVRAVAPAVYAHG